MNMRNDMSNNIKSEANGRKHRNASSAFCVPDDNPARAIIMPEDRWSPADALLGNMFEGGPEDDLTERVRKAMEEHYEEIEAGEDPSSSDLSWSGCNGGALCGAPAPSVNTYPFGTYMEGISDTLIAVYLDEYHEKGKGFADTLRHVLRFCHISTEVHGIKKRKAVYLITDTFRSATFRNYEEEMAMFRDIYNVEFRFVMLGRYSVNIIDPLPWHRV